MKYGSIADDDNSKKPQFRYPESAKKIIAYVRNRGLLFISEISVERLWEDFSDIYSAGYLNPNEQFLEEFVDYLDNIEL